MDFQTRRFDWQVRSDGKWLMIRCDSATEILDQVKADKEYDVIINEHYDKKSNQSNKYLWVLCEKVAKNLSQEKFTTKEEIYKNTIREAGVFKDDYVEQDMVKWRSSAWERLGLGWFAERVDFVDDKEQIRFYYGSSCYNKKQMCRLIDCITADCIALGIPTETPDEVARMLSLLEE